MRSLPRVLVLAGGFGTRLAHVVKDVPKPMAPIHGVPFLDLQIQYLRKQGFRHFTLLTGYKSEVIESYFGTGEKWDAVIDYSVETSPLGTGGAVKRAMLSSADDVFLVVNGDTLFTTNFVDFVKNSSGPASLALYLSKDLGRYGGVEIDSKFKITRFLEKSNHQSEGYINAGTYLIQRSCLDHWPDGPFSLERDFFELAQRKIQLQGVPCGGKFIDIGTPESYAWAQNHLEKWIQQKSSPALFLDRDGILIKHKPYLHKVTDVELNRPIIQIIHRAREQGLFVVVVTNQAGVGRGLFSLEDAQAVNHFIDQELTKVNAKPDLWLSCFDHVEAKIPEFRKDSLRRKPNPGMLLEACEALPVDLGASLMIGDNPTDQINLPNFPTFLLKGDFEITEVQKTTTVASSFEALEQSVTNFLKK